MVAWRQEVRAQLRLAVPVCVVQVGLLAMGAVDIAFLGRVSPLELAAGSIGHTWTFVFLAFGMGVLVALDPIVSQAWGARDLVAIGRGMQRGLVFAVGLSVLVMAAIWPVEAGLTALRQPPGVIPVAADYARIVALSAPAFLLFVALRHGLQAMHVLRPLVIVILASNVLNLLLDWVLILGNLGFEPRGAVGAAWATVIARWAMVVALPLITGSVLTRYLWPVRTGLLEAAALGRMLVLGLPVGVQFMIEVGAFSTVAFLMGQLGENELAGHQVAMSLASASFMVPLAISMAASVRVGNEVGRGDPRAVRQAAHVGMLGGALVMLGFGALFMIAPMPLSRIFTGLDEVLAVSVLLLPVAGLFQVFDGTQVVAVGIMRGMADTRVPMLIHVGGFWGIGIPLAWYLRGHGAVGLWWGLVGGLAVVAAVQFLRLRFVLERGVERVRIDGAPD